MFWALIKALHRLRVNRGTRPFENSTQHIERGHSSKNNVRVEGPSLRLIEHLIEGIQNSGASIPNYETLLSIPFRGVRSVLKGVDDGDFELQRGMK